MLLRLVGIALLAILLCTSNDAVAKTARKENSLIGPVRTVTTKAQGRSETETYDQAGNLIEASIDLEHENTSTRYLFHHDQQGNLQEEIAVDTGGKLLYRKRFAYAWDSDGRETASVAVSDNGEFHYAEFSLYDRFGNISEQFLVRDTTAHRSLFDVLGRVIYSARYSKWQLFSEMRHGYDERGRLKELISYNAEGAVTGKVVNEHDETGRRVRATTEKFHANNKRTWVTTYEYDGMGNWIKEATPEEPTTSQEAGTAQTYTVQKRVIEYYETHKTTTP